MPDLTWPPTLEEFKTDRQVSDDIDDESLQQNLDAAVAFVERVKDGLFDFSNGLDSGSDCLPAPDADLRLGTLRLAGRWKTRMRSPDGLLNLGELGSSRVPSFDPDIERLLRIGRYTPPVIA